MNVYQSGKCMQQASFTTDSVRIGALPTNDLVLKGEGICRLHAVIQRAIDGDGFTISATGEIRLNGIPISRAKLRQGDRLAFGSYEVVVESEQAFVDLPIITSDRGELMFLLTKKKAI